MNLTNLETLARRAFKGEDVKSSSNQMISRGLLTPAEHRSLTSLSFQIAANARANGNTVGAYAVPLGWQPWL